MSDRMRIGELAGRAGVTLRTIRHYERLGLLPKGEREGNGRHYYPEVSIARLEKIDQLKRLGLTLETVKRAAAENDKRVASPEDPCDYRHTQRQQRSNLFSPGASISRNLDPTRWTST